MDQNDFVRELSDLVDRGLESNLPAEDIIYSLQIEQEAVRDASGYRGEDR